MIEQMTDWVIYTPATLAQDGGSLAPAGGSPAAGGAGTGAGTGATGQGGGGGGAGGFNPAVIMPILLVMFVFMIFSSMMGQRKEKKKRADMLASLHKHAKVQTIGGVIGTISEIRDDEIVLKVDDSTNAKIRFARSAIQTVLSSPAGGGSAATAAEVEPEVVSRSRSGATAGV